MRAREVPDVKPEHKPKLEGSMKRERPIDLTQDDDDDTVARLSPVKREKRAFWKCSARRGDPGSDRELRDPRHDERISHVFLNESAFVLPTSISKQSGRIVANVPYNDRPGGFHGHKNLGKVLAPSPNTNANAPMDVMIVIDIRTRLCAK
jgi:hypothetical protein